MNTVVAQDKAMRYKCESRALFSANEKAGVGLPGLRKLPLLERELWCNAVSSVPEAACQRSSRGDALMGLHFLPALPSARPTDACGDRL